jgi:metal-sulfur cluster biosynthetic enzyme
MKKRTLLAIFTALTLTCSAAAFASCSLGGESSSSSSSSSTSEYAYELTTTFYSQDAGKDVTYYLNLKNDGTAQITFDNIYNGNGENQKIADGTWTKDSNNEIKTVVLDELPSVVDNTAGTVKVYLGLLQSGLIIAEESNAQMTLTFQYKEGEATDTPTEAAKGTVTVTATEHATVTIYDFSFTGGAVLAEDNKVTLGNYIAVKVEAEDGYEVDTVTVNEANAGYQNGYYCKSTSSDVTEYTVVVTMKAIEA